MLYIAAKEDKKKKYEKKESSFWTVKKKYNSADLSNKFCFRSAKRETLLRCRKIEGSFFQSGSSISCAHEP